MLVEHPHPLERFDPGHCRDCARENDLLDHYYDAQRQERALTQAQRLAWHAHRYAIWAGSSSVIAVLLAAIALLGADRTCEPT